MGERGKWHAFAFCTALSRYSIKQFYRFRIIIHSICIFSTNIFFVQMFFLCISGCADFCIKPTVYAIRAKVTRSKRFSFPVCRFFLSQFCWNVQFFILLQFAELYSILFCEYCKFFALMLQTDYIIQQPHCPRTFDSDACEREYERGRRTNPNGEYRTHVLVYERLPNTIHLHVFSQKLSSSALWQACTLANGPMLAFLIEFS